jgi:pimeloyl-ACP methyl ester carboxylesterase
MLICLAAVVLAGSAMLSSQAPPPPSAERVSFDQWVDAQATRALAHRHTEVTALATREAVQARQRHVRTAIADRLGLLPASDTPLNAVVTRTTRRSSTSAGAGAGYRIEHLLFESLPGFRVTALVYVPDGPGPFPAVLGTAGHADEGKASPTYQHAWVSLVRRGFVVLAYDPPGQGERYEYVDPATGTSRVGPGTREHMMTGQQVLLTGRTIGAYMVQDGRRALDYLLTRADVDPTRIAVAGNSGGGTQAALLAATEPRLAAAVVSCYMTSWSDMWVEPGPQDSEQILPGFVGAGLDFADFAVAAATRVPGQQRDSRLLPHCRIAEGLGRTRARVPADRRGRQTRSRRERRHPWLVATAPRRCVPRARRMAGSSRPSRRRGAGDA